jgi:hypothetical protein
LVIGISRVHEQYRIDAAENYARVNAEAGEESLNRSVQRPLGRQLIAFAPCFE